MPESEDNPLEGLHVNSAELNRELLAKTLDGVISIDEESGSARHRLGWAELNGREKFVYRLLFRVAAKDLGHLSGDEVGVGSEEVASAIGISDSTVRDYPGDMQFVENDRSKGGYYIPEYAVEEAISYIDSE